ncbi:hypothetical protein MNB_SUP05-SYMBIONT-7-553 [hydrothermal vent metagenome]|uniref:Uncharacterized protein n=1 Tax=hydrothermal vent metagenome TaxID=652676 RepID=A0A1W1E5A7_9ZZZZ
MKNYSQKIIKTTTFAFSIFTFLFSVEAQSIDPLNKYTNTNTNADPVTLASNTNDDVPLGLIFDKKSITVIESGGKSKPSEFTIRLTAKRIGPTYIRVEVDSYKDLIRLTRTPLFGRSYSVLTIKEDEWNVPQTVSVVAVNNYAIEADVDIKINVLSDSNQLLDTVTVTRKNDDMLFSNMSNTTPTKYSATTSPITGRVWLDRNLGATQVATSMLDTNAYGHYYQWGRAAYGHEKSNSTPSNNNTIEACGGGSGKQQYFLIGNGNWDESYTEDWTTPWFDINGTEREQCWAKTTGTIGAICPAGYHIPTKEDYAREASQLNTRAKAFNSFLKMPSAGYRWGGSDQDDTGGDLKNRGSLGLFWTRSPKRRIGDEPRYSYAFNIDTGKSYTNYRNDGLSVRCIKAN